jgi:hypothetical protein
MTTVKAYWEAMHKEKKYKDTTFCPSNPSMLPFDKQLAFLMDGSTTKLARCGNRSAKTFTSMRDLAWRVTRTHPYNPNFYCATEAEYMAQKPRKWWVAAPDLGFIHDVIWKQFLEMFIAQWYYTNDDLVPMVSLDKTNGKDAIQSLRFRNGDEITFRAYTQSLLSKMGASVDGGVYLDEPPPSLDILTELMIRTLDGGALFNMSFTPVNVPQEIIDYVENHTALAMHRWSLFDNPVFRDNPDKIERVKAELSHLPESKRLMRLNGDWDIDFQDTDRIFANTFPEEVDDFPVPANWRHVRMLDPAGHRSGFAIFAEDPKTFDWYCILARHIEWKGRTVKATDIEGECDKYAPHKEYRYFESIYDNAENWFGAHCDNNLGIWRPCILKNVELSITQARAAMSSGKLKFFRGAAALAVREIMRAERDPKTGKPKFKKLHSLDCIRYFCSQIPDPDPDWIGDSRTEEQRRIDASDEAMVKSWKEVEALENRSIQELVNQRRRR